MTDGLLVKIQFIEASTVEFPGVTVPIDVLDA
jgi:hypothetical protein